MQGHDVIHLRGLEFYAYHGLLAEERALGQKFQVDLDIFLSLQTAGYSDKVEDTVNYAEVYSIIQKYMLGEPVNLLENLAEQIARRVLADFSCYAVRVEIHKPQAPVPGIFRDISVEIWRKNKDALSLREERNESLFKSGE
ncbi:MAG: dihydroneopterin aldolase [Desulfitobacteriaceae bacterium]|nr:dihydroneopterin aldolase [Desulfitobacteriaceae bacterium]MDD4346063.1 dihydroneopterin aldolase [Desulfitobacteriaceae bacterium]MDD4401331.1 dihydroneopterin aldolase [Desulfitobacteriaceae bacterium]